MNLPDRVSVYEVGPRDGLQNVEQVVPTAVKVAFIEALSRSGLTAVEATSFVSPKWVSQLADAADVLRLLRTEGVRHPVLVPNEKGLDAAMAAGATEIAVFTAASDEFNRRNVNASIAESLERITAVASRARASGMRVRGYVSTAFGCPYQGDVPVDDVVRVVGALLDLGCDEISVGDTIGVADPAQVERVIPRLAARFGLARLALHFHDTYGRALANVVAALQVGVTTFDSSAGGLGGCPYAPGAAGNLATEDLVALLDRMGVATGVDVHAVASASRALCAATGLSAPSRVLAALPRRPEDVF